ncbi:hypothetical protein HYS28_01350 [Candidatus Uhrbacteria bacterium]|nr:hypothetical protein [Candidatus Uhrbacteria bacterium]
MHNTEIPGLLLKIDKIRSVSEGDVAKARQLAKGIALFTPPVVEMIALSVDWRNNRDAFWKACRKVQGSQGAPVQILAKAVEHRAATCEDPDERVQLFGFALDLAHRQRVTGIDREYMLACCITGVMETSGEHMNLNMYLGATKWMVEHGAFNAPGRVAIAAEAVARKYTREMAMDLIKHCLARQHEPDCFFSARQLAVLDDRYRRIEAWAQ